MFKISYEIEENIIIEKDIKTVWENIIYFNNSKKWSPWLILDKTCISNIEWTDWTLDAKYSWNWEIIWQWQQYLTEITNYSEIKSKVIFIKPFKNTWEVSFKFEEVDDKTKVTWTLKSYLPIFLFFLKKMISSMLKRDLRRWLKMLKVVCEQWEIQTKTDIEKNIKLDWFYWMWIKNSSTLESIGETMWKDIWNLQKISQEKSISCLWFLAFYTKNCNMDKWIYEFITSYKISKEDFDKLESEQDIIKWHYESTNSLKVTHHWDYAFLENSWTWVYSALHWYKLKQSKEQNPFELYINNPHNTEKKDLITEIYLPIK